MITVDACVWVALLDASDSLHGATKTFWRLVAESNTTIYGPRFLLLEVGCAIARRTHNADKGRNVVSVLQTIPTLKLVENDKLLLEKAVEIGTKHYLRAGDALYLAVAMKTATPLVTWDQELIARAGAISPVLWR